MARVIGIACAALAALALTQCDSDEPSANGPATSAGTAAGTTAARPVPKAGCSSLVEQPVMPPTKNDIAVGPVILRGARAHATRPRVEFKPRHGRQAIAKMGFVVQPGTRVVFAIDRRDRAHAGLIYREKKRGAQRVSEADPAIRFKACFPDSPTGWPGGVIVSGARCVRITLDIAGRSRPASRRLAFGRGTCG